VLSGMTALLLMSLVFIFSHDCLVQSPYFGAREIHIEGNQRVSTRELLHQAQLHPGINVLSVNLRLVRKRLLAHPWVNAAEVSRSFPPRLRIRVREHEPLAILEIGQRRFGLDSQGQVFMEWHGKDPDGLPHVTGLTFADLPLDDRPATRPFKALMAVLQSGRQPDSVLPGKAIATIRVDRQLGLTLLAFEDRKLIQLGYGDYPAKYERLRAVLHYLKAHHSYAAYRSIDLMQTERIVLNPVRLGARPAKRKEV
jgi:cell division protein FtsQ